MANIPQITLNKTSLYRGFRNDKGLMCNIYTPLQNLSEATTKVLGDFTTEQLEFDMEHPVDILLLDSYDGAVNMILNDGKNPPRLINSRFSVQDEGTFKIPDHTGFKDTNIYEEDSFDVDTRLKSIPYKIPTLKYEGLIDNGGKMGCGSYSFFFKLADADGNETEVIAESGIVQCHIGQVNKPSSIRAGLLNENSSKAIHFTLSDIDSGFDYIHVLYARTSSAEDQAPATTYHKVVFDYPIVIETNPKTGEYFGTCDVIVTGAETIIGIGRDECAVDYADIHSVKTLTISNNVLLFGNVSTFEHDWDAIRRFSWKIIPRVKLAEEGSVGGLNTQYEDFAVSEADKSEKGYCYYNTKNVYYRVGYWPEEIYRFGIVYIFNDNSLSPVIDLQGIDLTIKEVLKAADSESSGLSLREWTTDYEKLFFTEDTDNESRYPEYLYENENLYFNEKYRTNSRGVIKFPQANVINATSDGMVPKPLYINFDLSKIGYKYAKAPKSGDSEPEGDRMAWDKVLKQHHIKGFFFVRLKRVPTILGLGVVIGLSDKARGSLPVIKSGGNYVVQPFLDNKRLLREEAVDYYVTDKGQFSCQAMLVPEAEIKEATYNQLFVSNDFALSKCGSILFDYDPEDHTAHGRSFSEDFRNIVYTTKLLNVPEDTKILTNGTDFFSTLAGSPHEAYKTSDIEKEWRWSYPQDLTTSTTLLRGKWGPYVGMSNPNANSGGKCPFKYGEVYNIKHPDFAKSETINLYFMNAMNSHENFFAISHRTEAVENIDCYRGDCFISMFTHKMFRNFIDPELPTNTLIVNPACWVENYGVRCTSVPMVASYSNLASEPEGWMVGPKWEVEEYRRSMTVKIITMILTGNILGLIAYAIQASKDLDRIEKEAKKDMRTRFQYGLANEIVPAFETYIPLSERYTSESLTVPTAEMRADRDFPETFANGLPRRKKVNPKELEQSGALGVLKQIFKSDDAWELHGLASINRADVNAVGMGQWITFPICANENLAMRDIDFSNATEEAAFNRKRSFFPLSKKLSHDPLRDSNVINWAAGISIPNREYFQLPKVPYFKQEYFTRIYNSIRDSANSITNEFKIMLESSYRDYTKVYGSITKLEAYNGNVYIIFKHGIGVLAFNQTSAQASTADEFLQEMAVMSDKFGSIWKDSIIKTDTGIYGVDTVAKVIWKIEGDGLKIISDTRIGKFLIDNIDMSEFIFRPYIGHVNVKSHYNAFKHDVMFTYYNDKLYEFPYTEEGGIKYHIFSAEDSDINLDGFVTDLEGNIRYDEEGNAVKAILLLPYYKTTDEDSDDVPDLEWTTYSELINSATEKTLIDSSEDITVNQEYSYKCCYKWVKGTQWSVCWNEDVGMFQTFYDWIPLESENIDNIYFSFDKEGIQDMTNQTQWLAPSFYKEDGSELRQKLGISILKSQIDSAFTNPTKYFVIKPTYRITPVIKQTIVLEAGEQQVFSMYVKCAESSSDIKILPKVTILIGQTADNASYSIKSLSSEWSLILIFLKNQSEQDITLSDITINIVHGTEPFVFAEPKITKTDIKHNYSSANTLVYNAEELQQVNGMFKDYYDIRSCDNSMKLWKHGQAGLFDNQGKILPTNWYGKQHEFNFEFVVNENSSIQKIYNNLKIISNKVEPYKFEYEVVGESYEWFEYKAIVQWINQQVKDQTPGFDTLENGYLKVLSTPYEELRVEYQDFPELFYDRGITPQWKIKKLPYFEIKLKDKQGLPDKDRSYTSTDKWTDIKATDIYDPQAQNRPNNYKFNTSDAIIVEDLQLNEYRVHTELYGNNMKKYGRVRGNMEYLEDLWDVEIRPIPVKWAWIKNEELQFETAETRHRDKYIKIKVRYTGEDLVVIQAILTMFDYSYA